MRNLKYPVAYGVSYVSFGFSRDLGGSGRECEHAERLAEARTLPSMTLICRSARKRYILAMSRTRKTARLGRIEQDILVRLSAGDMLYGFLTSGRSTRAMYRNARTRATEAYRRRLAVERFVQCGYVSRKGEVIAIRKDGHRALDRATHFLKKSIGNTKWDGKWRVVVFDIPERLRRMRYEVRSILKRAGFVQLQKSVWIFPHESQELVELLQRETNLSDCVLYGVLERIEQDEKLRRKFSLLI